jgi:hypothetical protein
MKVKASPEVTVPVNPKQVSAARRQRAGECYDELAADDGGDIMEPKGLDMGDYEEHYKDCEIEVAVEQVLTGVKAHFRVLKGDAVVLDWQLVHIDRLWATEHAAAEAGFEAARVWIDAHPA